MTKTIMLAAALVSMPSLAEARRTLDAPATAEWKHAKTGMVLPQRLGGLPRVSIEDLGDDELDLMTQYYEPADTRTQATVYLFKPGLDSLPVWFDRVETQIQIRPIYGTAVPVRPEPVSFARVGATVPDSLMQVYSGTGEFVSTGAAAMPLGGWLVVVRLSSKNLKADALESLLRSFVADLRFPASASPAAAAVPVKACPTTIATARAKQVKPDGASVLMSALSSTVAAASTGPRTALCRDGVATSDWAMYRAVVGDAGYVLAFGDAGKAVAVAPDPIAKSRGQRTYTVTFLDLDGTSVYPSFDRLPPPRQVIELLNTAKPVSRTQGATVMLGTDALGK